MTTRNVVLNWGIKSYSGWGLVGLNLFSQWQGHGDLDVYSSKPILESEVPGIGPFQLAAIVDSVIRSNDAVEAGMFRDGACKLDHAIVINPLGNSLTSFDLQGAALSIGRCIFENTAIQNVAQALTRYDAVLTGSHWNARLIERHTDVEVKVIPEGVDHSLFCPGPKSGMFSPDKFYIYSGGKAEWRKGQDLVLAAFKAFHARHPEAVLVTAWHSPWVDISVGMVGPAGAVLHQDAKGILDVRRWVFENGIPLSAFVDLGRYFNQQLPPVLREMDVVIQPSRAEACSCLPVLEAMACGIPVIGAANTGLMEVLSSENALPLTRQTPISLSDTGTEGWGESDVEEMIEALEWVYQHRVDAARLGLAGRDWLVRNDRTWHAHAASLKRWLLAMQ